ncbi:bacteriocin [Enterococcus sp. N249-2]
MKESIKINILSEEELENITGGKNKIIYVFTQLMGKK